MTNITGCNKLPINPTELNNGNNIIFHLYIDHLTGLYLQQLKSRKW